MKVGIFTFPNSISYGASLQMYALYCTVKALGHTAEIVNYHNAFMKAEKHMGAKYANRRRKLKLFVRRFLHMRIYRVFRAFETKHFMVYPQKAFSDKEMLPQIGQRYGAVICGSDQVWNPDITGGDMSYFLDFCGPETRRISYAPSFGIDTFPDDFRSEIKGEIEKFHALSVRELPGQRLVEELTGCKAPIVCDPTILLEASDWEKLEKPHPAADGEYVLYFTVHSSGALLQKAKELARRTGLKLVIVGGNFLRNLRNKDKNVVYATDLDQAQWLYLVHHARYVVTNSFHGTAFSIIFRRNLQVEFSSPTNSRLYQILHDLGLDDCIAGSEPLQAKETDYTVAEQMLPSIRKASLDYLKNALK